MGIIVLILLAGLILWFLWWLFVKSFMWTIEPVVKCFEDKDEVAELDAEEDEFDSFAEEEKTNLPVPEILKGKKIIRMIWYCPKCKKATTCYDAEMKRSRCTNCDWVNNIDPEMTLEEFYNAYNTMIDKSELSKEG